MENKYILNLTKEIGEGSDIKGDFDSEKFDEVRKVRRKIRVQLRVTWTRRILITSKGG